MKISSPAFDENAKIPKMYSYLGGNKRPPLHIADVPAAAKSLVLICHDPDAPRPGGFYHWTAWNISPATSEIASETLPEGVVEGMTNWGRPGYNGPQPPFGTHRYQFYVYALDTVLDLPADTKPKPLKEAMESHIIEQSVLTGKFGVFDILRRG